MTEDILIRNCKFAFKCTKTWNSLEMSEDAKIRFCDDCKRNVHFCKNDSELLIALRNNECIAVTQHSNNNDECEMMIGEPIAPYKVD